tara:strand:- start:13534 stop:14100 length:567 start_codon:yes stop_codon:yes gene_type:complete
MESVLKKIGLRLKSARTALTDLQSQDFAKILNIAPSTYSQHEKGKRSPSIESIIKYAEYYSIHPEWILTGNSCITNPYDRDNEIKVRDKALLLGLEDNLFLPQVKLNSQCVVDVEILLEIFSEIIKASIKLSPSLSIEELQEFCLDIYNNVAPLDASIENKINMISLSIESLIKGLGKNIELNKTASA